jgi:hypothetical protein
MTDLHSPGGAQQPYRFTRPDGTELETSEQAGDDAADSRAHELSRAQRVPVIIHRQEAGDDWAYVTEVDDRP